MTREPEPVALQSSWRGLIVGLLTPGLLLALAIGGSVVAGRIGVLALVAAVAAVGFAGATLLGLPRQSLLDASGIERRCVLRTRKIPWSSVDAIERAPGPIVATPQDPDQRRSGRQPGGLTARLGRRRLLLADVAEMSWEYGELRDAMAVWCPDVVLRAAPPPEVDPRHR